MLTEIFALFLLAYLCGSIPFGLLLSKTQNIDIREHGSGNIGATNVARTMGKKAGLLTLAGDVLKGWGTVFLANLWFDKPNIIALAGLAVFLGHLFSIFLNFKGGKGVATGLGVFSFVMPLPTLISAGIFALSLKISGYVSLSSILAALSLPILGIFFRVPFPFIYLAVIVALFTLQKHHSNILRLVEGTEAKFLKK
ncbi:MAG: glycerol-3-phosphate 1-O-acyltransferase PlsY [Nitrospina sp.]|jgi:glycerol-3-phosphate acyltransferase PlsY|nr:glycerol-3-phosphate 1-O-acyltransferase PlsY [Nitrospina sp.]MBT6717246.1 glycerol-3-phosphate 1-O-acyltransferase PlsY [Nitrospina sp.]